jgi:hypothetical protein
LDLSPFSAAWMLPIGLAAAILVADGCGSRRPATAPVEGKVVYRGKPLEFGSVLFQPDAGPPARGAIQADGTFHLSTHRDGDGAVLGVHRVQVVCNDMQRPGAASQTSQEPGVGKSYIPPKYSRYDTSGLTREVRARNEPVVLELTD